MNTILISSRSNLSLFALCKSIVSLFTERSMVHKKQWNIKLIIKNLLSLHPCLLSIFTKTPFLGPRVLDDFNSRGTYTEQRIACRGKKCHYSLTVLNTFQTTDSVQVTLVSEQATRLNLRKRRTRAILISSWASLIPTQLRGPAPKGMYTNGWRAALASGVNLENQVQSSHESIC